MQFARTEGKIPAPEAGARHPRGDRRGADAKAKGEERVILFNYSGHGLLDLAAYQEYLAGDLAEEP